MYEYKALVVKVYDADTITVDIDLGFNTILKNQKIRLLGINAPEVRGEERELGINARDKLRTKILSKNVVIRTKKDKKGKYGRWLAVIMLKEENINQWLLKKGLAKPYD